MRLVWRHALLEPANDAGPDLPAGLTLQQYVSAITESLSFDEMQAPGTIASTTLMVTLILNNPAAFAQAVRVYRANMGVWAQQQAAAGAISAAIAQQVQQIVNGLAIADDIDAGVKALESLPVVGTVANVVDKIYNFIKQIVIGTAGQGGNGFHPVITESTTTIFTGYKNGGYYFWDQPVLSLTAALFAGLYKDYRVFGSNFAPMLDSLANLATTYPASCPVSTVAIQDGYGYSFRASDGSTRSFDVWSPLDVTPEGPRGFTVEHPNWWKFAWGRLNVLDVPLPFKRQVDPFMALGLSNVRTLTTAQIAAIPYLQEQSDANGTQIIGPITQTVGANESPLPWQQFSGYYAKVAGAGNSFTYYFVATGVPWAASAAPVPAPASTPASKLISVKVTPAAPAASKMSGTTKVLIGLAVVGGLALASGGES